MSHKTNLLTERELDVARVLLQGKSNKQIALELGITTRTVEFHLRNIYAKLGVASRAEAILTLAERGLLKTTGTVPVESTVEETSDPIENEANVISWRIPVKKTLFILGGLLLASLLALGLVLDQTWQRGDTTPAPVEATPITQADVPVGTVPAPEQTSAPEQVVIPPHTVNGYTASIESYYIDVSHIIFQVRLTGQDLVPGRKFDVARLGSTDIYDEVSRAR
jgi:DNA-binding CsgD family transcriptional regulator